MKDKIWLKSKQKIVLRNGRPQVRGGYSLFISLASLYLSFSLLINPFHERLLVIVRSSLIFFIFFFEKCKFWALFEAYTLEALF